jgi:hypothetical protein
VLALLKHAATEQPSSSGDRFGPLPVQELDDRQFQYVIDAGMAPLLYRAIRDQIDQVPAARRDALLSAELTAQVRHGNLIDTANEVIDTCRHLQVPITLLKGISISDQHYPAGHLRPMGDIDVLIPAQAYESVESALLRRGYSQKSDDHRGQDPHHGVPLFHPQRHVWIELHTALFRKSASLRRNRVFSSSQIAAQSVTSTFHGRPVHRLTDELQLAYTASSWIKDLSRNGIHPSFLIPLLDAIFLLKASGRTLDWEGMLGWLDNNMAIASLYLMLAYLSRQGLNHSADSILPRLASMQDIVGPAELGIINAIVDNYLVGGKPGARAFTEWHAWIVLNTLLAPGSHAAKLLSLPWNLAFPPGLPGRYTVRYQLGRITRALRARD